MSVNILSEYSDRVQYFLNSKSLGSIKIPEPIGWDDDDKEYTRNAEYHGIFTTLSKSLKFIKSSKDIIETTYQLEGINAEQTLTKEEKNNTNDVWENVYSGYLDYSTLEIENGAASIKFNGGGLESLLKSRENETIEIDRKTTLDDKPVDDLITEKITLNGRRIFLESTWKAVQMNYHKQLLVQTAATTGGTRYTSNTFPFDIVKRSHEETNSLYDGLNGNDGIGQTTMMLLSPVDRVRTFKVFIEELQFNYFGTYLGKVNSGFVSISLVKYRLENELVRISDSVVELWRKDFYAKEIIPPSNHTISYFEHIITLSQGEALGLEILLKADFASDWLSVGHTFKRDFNYRLQSGKITIQEDSFFQPTTCNAVSPFYLANRLVEIITNKKNAVRSSLLETGKWKDLMITHGLWIRGFSKEKDDNLPEESRKFKPLTTSFKDFITSLSAVANIGVGIEKIGAREYVVIEDLKYFYNRNTTIRLPNQISNVKRTIDASRYYQSIMIGYEKGGEYEEVMGLDEYNTQNTYSTCIRRLDNKYTAISKYRADSYGIEFARRKQFETYSMEDTSYDQDIFFIDCKPGNRLNPNKQPRLWEDDFENIPTGVFSPETAFNLRISPMNNLLRHAWYFGGGLEKYPLKKLMYTSSRGNSNLKTIYTESQDIVNGELENPRFIPELIEFEHFCDSEILKQVNGHTYFLGTKVRNSYGLVEFINENGQIERGYLLSLKPNGAGKWRLLKYNF